MPADSKSRNRQLTHQARIKAAFYRGGTSNAVMFSGSALPRDQAARDRIILSVLGSPDPYGRQLNGLGGGVSSLSKAVIVQRSKCEGTDLDCTFAQVSIDKPIVDYGSICVNMCAAVGPFAVDERILSVPDGNVEVSVRDTNTGKSFLSTFDVSDGRAVEEGELEIPGVAGTGAPVSLHFLYPFGSLTDHLLPSGKTRDALEVGEAEPITASLVDATNPVAFVRAEDIGLDCTEVPNKLDEDTEVLDLLERIRQAASKAMGISKSSANAPPCAPTVAVIAPPKPFTALDGRRYAADKHDLAIRMVSMGRFHRAVEMSAAICAAAASGVPGTIVNEIFEYDDLISIGCPSGVVPVQAVVRAPGKVYRAATATVLRTQRRIMEGKVLVPAALLPKKS